MKLRDCRSAQFKSFWLGAKSGFTLVEVVVASGIMMIVLGGAMAFTNMAGVSISGITAQNIANGKAGETLELIQSRVRFATSISNNTSGNILTLGFDDNYTVDSDGDGKSYNDKNHFEQFKFVGVNSTNETACSSNSLVYIYNVAANQSRVLIPKGVRNLPLKNIFTLTNLTTAVIRFGIVDCNSRDFYQAIEIQATAVSLNRPSTTNIIGILP